MYVHMCMHTDMQVRTGIYLSMHVVTYMYAHARLCHAYVCKFVSLYVCLRAQTVYFT